MSLSDDDLARPASAERVAYFDGALLSAADFRAEQTYHRGRLARALVYLHGAGTVAGLDVRAEPEAGDGVEIKVAPGFAIDRLGRLVELPFEACLRLARWFEQQRADPGDARRAGGAEALQNGFRSGGAGVPDHVVVDVFLAFVACARTPQPAFATGNADQLDAVQPSRLQDSARLALVIRDRAADPVPQPVVPPATGATAAERRASLHAFKRTAYWQAYQLEREDPPQLPKGPEHTAEHDGSELLLARLRIPATAGADGAPPGLDVNQPVPVDNDLRLYVYTALERALIAQSESEGDGNG